MLVLRAGNVRSKMNWTNVIVGHFCQETAQNAVLRLNFMRKTYNA
jgi:hypothetical protein